MRIALLLLGGLLLLELRDLTLGLRERGLGSRSRLGDRGGALVRGLLARLEALLGGGQLLGLLVGLLLQVGDPVDVAGDLVAERGDLVGDAHVGVVQGVR